MSKKYPLFTESLITIIQKFCQLDISFVVNTNLSMEKLKKAKPSGKEFALIAKELNLDSTELFALVGADMIKKLINSKAHIHLTYEEQTQLNLLAQPILKSISFTPKTEKPTDEFVRFCAGILSYDMPRDLIPSTTLPKSQLVNLVYKLVDKKCDAGHLVYLFSKVRKEFNLCPFAIKGIVGKAIQDNCLKITPDVLEMLIEIGMNNVLLADYDNLSRQDAASLKQKLIEQYHRMFWELADSPNKFFTSLGVLFGDNITAKDIADVYSLSDGNMKLNDLAILDYSNNQHCNKRLMPTGFLNSTILFAQSSKSALNENKEKINAALMERVKRYVSKSDTVCTEFTEIEPQKSRTKINETLVFDILVKALRFGDLATIDNLNRFMKGNNLEWKKIPNLLQCPIENLDRFMNVNSLEWKKTSNLTQHSIENGNPTEGFQIAGTLADYLKYHKHDDGFVSVIPTTKMLLLAFYANGFASFKNNPLVYKGSHCLVDINCTEQKKNSINADLLFESDLTRLNGSNLETFGMNESEEFVEMFPDGYIFALTLLLHHKQYDTILCEIPRVYCCMTASNQSDVIDAIMYSAVLHAKKAQISNFVDETSPLGLKATYEYLLTRDVNSIFQISSQSINKHPFSEPYRNDVIYQSLRSAKEVFKNSGKSSVGSFFAKKIAESSGSHDTFFEKMNTHIDFEYCNNTQSTACSVARLFLALSQNNNFSLDIQAKTKEELIEYNSTHVESDTVHMAARKSDNLDLVYTALKAILQPYINKDTPTYEYNARFMQHLFNALLKHNCCALNKTPAPKLDVVSSELISLDPDYQQFHEEDFTVQLNKAGGSFIAEALKKDISLSLYSMLTKKNKLSNSLNYRGDGFYLNENVAYIPFMPKSWMSLFENISDKAYEEGIDVDTLSFLYMDDTNNVSELKLTLTCGKESLKWLTTCSLIYS